ncbi:MAG: PTS sugar transporter subunit IIA [Myxococcales bacterium]|nr:PTS sugar transporter subunit IIA [Myxococcales bacterium]
MRLTELLSPERVGIEKAGGDFDKERALARLAVMLGGGVHMDAHEVERVLTEREALQSTGIGDGVAIPHGALPGLDVQCAALLIVPAGIEFSAIDNGKVNILFAVIGPKRATGEHLKTLARVSRLLRNRDFRDRLVAAGSAEDVFTMIGVEEGDRASLGSVDRAIEGKP